jgi:uncharacterized protein (TIGR03086 family)
MTQTTDIRSYLYEAQAAAQPVIAAAQQKSRDLPTPCAELPLGKLLAHLNAVAERINALGKSGSVAGVSDQVPTEDYAAAWTTASRRAQEVWEQRDLDDVVQVPWGELSGREAIGIYAAEVVAHTWDVAQAIGHHYEIGPELGEFCETAYSLAIPPESRRAMFDQVASALPPGVPWQDPFGPAVEVAEDAPPVDRVVAISGRNPAWTP